MSDTKSVGTTLGFGAGPTLVGQIMSLSGPDGDTTDINTSDYEITDDFQTYISGMHDAGELTATLKFNKAEYAALYAVVGTTQTWTITLKDGSTLAFSGHLKYPSFDFADADGDGLVTNEITIKVSGKPTFTAAA